MDIDDEAAVMAGKRKLHRQLQDVRNSLKQHRPNQADMWKHMKPLVDIKGNLKKYAGVVSQTTSRDGKLNAPSFRSLLKYAVEDAELLGEWGTSCSR
jgi:hypothetical protein